LNDRDPVEVNDLVIQSFKNYLIKDMMRESDDISQQHDGGGIENMSKNRLQTIEENILNFLLFDDFMSSESAVVRDKSNNVDYEYLSDQLDSADYISDSLFSNKKEEVIEIVRSYITGSRRFLPILNNCFHRDPDPGKAKFLVLRFKNDVTIKVREKLVVDEKMLRKRDVGVLTQQSEHIKESTATYFVNSLKVSFL